MDFLYNAKSMPAHRRCISDSIAISCNDPIVIPLNIIQLLKDYPYINIE